jgi:hypothetical protein
MGNSNLFGDTDPLLVTVHPDIGEALVTVGEIAVFVLKGDVIETGSHHAVIDDGVGNQQGHANGNNSWSFLFVARNHGIGVTERAVRFAELEILAEKLVHLVPILSQLNLEPILFELGDRFLVRYPVAFLATAGLAAEGGFGV